MNPTARRGFTLVEIMIVVVIIGLLAALAIPAFKKVRNNAIEKSLINDARQITSAVQQHCSENATTYATLPAIGKFLAGGRLSAGVMLAPDQTYSLTDYGDLSAANAVHNLRIANDAWSYFYLGHVNYDKTLSSNATILASGGAPMATSTPNNNIKFDTASGQPVP